MGVPLIVDLISMMRMGDGENSEDTRDLYADQSLEEQATEINYYFHYNSTDSKMLQDFRYETNAAGLITKFM